MQRKIVQQLLFKLYFKIMDYFKKLFKIGKDKKRETFKSTLLFFIMPQTGIEPVREYKSRRILSPVRLPVPPLRHFVRSVFDEGIRASTVPSNLLTQWAMVDSNHRRRCQQIYSLSPLATREIAHILLKQINYIITF